MPDPQLEAHLTAVSRWEPSVHALIDWREEDARARAEVAGGGPLAGWAVGVKDIIDVQGVPTRCGVDFLPGDAKPRNAAIVSLLEELGAYVFAKVVTTAFAYLDPGATRNPWNVEHTPGGSSMGSAAAVACGMVRVALGTQTIGSVGRPASYCGVVGFKPSFSSVPQAGLFLFSPSVDTVGFFTRTTVDMLTLADALLPAASSPAPEPSLPRVGVVHDLFCETADPEMHAALDEVAGALSRAGWNVDPDARLDRALAAADENHRRIVAAEAFRAHEGLYARYTEHYTPKLEELLHTGRDVTDRELAERLAAKDHLAGVLDAQFERWDLLIVPGAPGAAPRGLAATGDPRMSLLSTHTGVPALTMPVKRNDQNLPLGVQLLGRAGADRTLTRYATAIDATTGYDGASPPLSP